MNDKQITAECVTCDSSFEITYVEELVSEEYPSFCPFCGEPIEELSESEYIEDDDDLDEFHKWDN